MKKAYELLEGLLEVLDTQGPMTRREIEVALGLDIKSASVLLVRAHRKHHCVHISGWRKQPNGMRERSPIYAAWPGDDVPKPRKLYRGERRAREMKRYWEAKAEREAVEQAEADRIKAWEDARRRAGWSQVPRSIFDVPRVVQADGRFKVPLQEKYK